jgi:hypothetical protein
LSFHDNQITRHENIPCVIVGPRQSSSRRDRRNGHPDCRCVLIQIVALHRRQLLLNLIAYNLIRIPKLMAA